MLNILAPNSSQNTKSEFMVCWWKERPKMTNNNRGSKFKIAVAKIEGNPILERDRYVIFKKGESEREEERHR